jgi:hypothetical protein
MRGRLRRDVILELRGGRLIGVEQEVRYGTLELSAHNRVEQDGRVGY